MTRDSPLMMGDVYRWTCNLPCQNNPSLGASHLLMVSVCVDLDLCPLVVAIAGCSDQWTKVNGQ